jgi:hypothetical protein
MNSIVQPAFTAHDVALAADFSQYTKRVCALGAKEAEATHPPNTVAAGRRLAYQIVRRHPEFLVPLCRDGFANAVMRRPEEFKWHFQPSPHGYGQRICHYLVTPDTLKPDGSLKRRPMSAIWRKHPRLAAPLLYAEFMSGTIRKWRAS